MVKKFLTLWVFLFLISIFSVNAQVGCCTNPGAQSLSVCTSPDLVTLSACCPTPEGNDQYYNSIGGPRNAAECSSNFFFQNTACSDPSITTCVQGCCCSDIGGSTTSKAQCLPSNFHEVVECSIACPLPQCNDKIDNDGNGCADFSIDSGCTSQADTSESGGICLTTAVNCNNPAYDPKLSNLDIIPLKGEKKFQLRWQDECQAISYDVSRCKGSACTDFALIAPTNTNSFVDTSPDLIFGTTYNYKVKAHYSLQSSEPVVIGTATLGDIKCTDRTTTNPFCSDNTPFICDANNKLIQQGSACSSEKVCVIDSNVPKCAVKSACNYEAANPFGLFANQQACENQGYCFYDKSQTIVNSCFTCDTSMVCYDYKTQGACESNNCKIQNCEWRSTSEELGTGVCVNTKTNNCQFCNQPEPSDVGTSNSFNSVFDLCTEQKSEKLSVKDFQCFFQGGSASSCQDVNCLNYAIDECSSVNIQHDSLNKITNPSNDDCGIGTCQVFGSGCKKNADGDDKPDCTEANCEKDYFPPDTTLIPIVDNGIYKSMTVQIFDRSANNLTATRRTSNDYNTFLCLEPCNSDGHPYDVSTNTYNLIIGNLNLYDSSNGNKLLSFSEGTNTISYYSQDPKKNLGLVKTIEVIAFEDSAGPIILSTEVSEATVIDNTFYTNNLNPAITVEFVEPDTTITRAILRSETGLTVSPKGISGTKKTFDFTFNEQLEQGTYVLELNAVNSNGLSMGIERIIIVLDNTAPTVTVRPSNNEVLTDSNVEIGLEFNERVKLQQILLNDNNIKNSLTTEDDIIFTVNLDLLDANFELIVDAKDYAGNKIVSTSNFVLNGQPTTISLKDPSFGISSVYTFDVVVETDNNANCRYSFIDNLEYDFMTEFDTTGAVRHILSQFNQIPAGSKSEFSLNVKCNDPLQGLGSNTFSLRVDPDAPTIREAFANPDPVVEEPIETTLTINTNKETICKYSQTESDFDLMENKFPDFDENLFKTVHKNNVTATEGSSFKYNVACIAKNELISGTMEIEFTVDLNAPITVISHTPAFSDKTGIVLAVETNKKSQCKFSRDDPSVTSGTVFGSPEYSHTRSLQAAPGKNTYYVLCIGKNQEKSDVLQIDVTVDTTAPIMESVDDSSRLTDNPEFTYLTDRLRVKWLGKDDETRVSSYNYTLEEFGNLNTVVNWTKSFKENEWMFVEDLNLVNGAKYLFRVKAQNVVGFVSEPKSSDGITIDTNLKPSSCSNNIKDGLETDTDCGGPCVRCSIGRACSQNIDCSSSFCNNNLCAAASCTDNAKNQDESDTDCGGNNCNACQNSKICNVNPDCASGFCSFGACSDAEACEDGKLTGTESDIDCGGACSNKCSVGDACDADGDCTSGSSCYNSKCTICNSENGFCGIQPETEKDSDGDGIPDKWEIDNGLDPNDPNDALDDEDGDGLTNLDEYKIRTNINNADTDGDKFGDKKEVDKETDPLDPDSRPKSRLGFVLLMIFLVILLAGGSYAGYFYYMKQKEEIELPIIPIRRPTMPMQNPIIMPLRRRRIRMREILKKKQLEKKSKREKLFTAFGAKTEKKQPIISKKSIPKTKTEQETKKMPGIKEDAMGKLRKLSKKSVQKNTPKEDAFKKLKKIVKARKK